MQNVSSYPPNTTELLKECTDDIYTHFLIKLHLSTNSKLRINAKMLENLRKMIENVCHNDVTSIDVVKM